MAKNWIPLRQVEGTASRQAHVRLPAGTYEREISKEGFFGPSAQFHHRQYPTSPRLKAPLDFGPVGGHEASRLGSANAPHRR